MDRREAEADEGECQGERLDLTQEQLEGFQYGSTRASVLRRRLWPQQRREGGCSAGSGGTSEDQNGRRACLSGTRSGTQVSCLPVPCSLGWAIGIWAPGSGAEADLAPQGRFQG